MNSQEKHAALIGTVGLQPQNRDNTGYSFMCLHSSLSLLEKLYADESCDVTRSVEAEPEREPLLSREA